jgi:hypothetical protein
VNGLGPDRGRRLPSRCFGDDLDPVPLDGRVSWTGALEARAAHTSRPRPGSFYSQNSQKERLPGGRAEFCGFRE